MKVKKYLSSIFTFTLLLFVLSGCNNPTDPDGKKVAKPTFNPPPATYTAEQNITISCATAGADIFYSTDGSAPSIQYTGPVTLSTSSTLKAKATKSGLTDSSIASAVYTIDTSNSAQTPIITPPGGTYSAAQNVVLSCNSVFADIRYTTDGSEPTSSSTLYRDPILVSRATTIKARGFESGFTDSAIASATYAVVLAPVEMIYVNSGNFTMGDTRGDGEEIELPTHSVTVSSFHLGKYEVTQAQYAAVMAINPASDYGVDDNYPVYQVNFHDAIMYCNLRSLNEGLTPVFTINGSTDPANWGAWDSVIWNSVLCDWAANGYRLPTEAEWEYAARGASSSPDYKYSGSDNIDAVAWYSSDDRVFTVGTKSPNGLGLYDMSGNVMESCWDWYSAYTGSSANNPTGPETGMFRTLRGGHWMAPAKDCTVSYRSFQWSIFASHYSGFRLCRSSL